MKPLVVLFATHVWSCFMKVYLNIAALAATMLAAPVFAASSAPTLTRAEVVSQIPAHGTPWGEAIDYPQGYATPVDAPALTRAEVASQIPAHGTPWGGAIDYPQGYAKASSAPARTRAEVRAELAQAVASGTRPSGSINYPDRY
jgi:hypothetical protein